MDVIIDGVRYVKAEQRAENPELLDFVFPHSDLGHISIREYFHALLKQLWKDGERFSGKYPFGNSGWEYDLYYALAEAGEIAGKRDDEKTYDEDGLLEHSHWKISQEEKNKANGIVFDLIATMCGMPTEE
jgi:hypothetical protein